MREPLSIRAKKEHRCEYLVVAHIFHDLKMPIENLFKGVTPPELGDHIALVKLQRLAQSGRKRHLLSACEFVTAV
jgi:hypothetical protein